MSWASSASGVDIAFDSPVKQGTARPHTARNALVERTPERLLSANSQKASADLILDSRWKVKRELGDGDYGTTPRLKKINLGRIVVPTAVTTIPMTSSDSWAITMKFSDEAAPAVVPEPSPVKSVDLDGFIQDCLDGLWLVREQMELMQNENCASTTQLENQKSASIRFGKHSDNHLSNKESFVDSGVRSIHRSLQMRLKTIGENPQEQLDLERRCLEIKRMNKKRRKEGHDFVSTNIRLQEARNPNAIRSQQEEKQALRQQRETYCQEQKNRFFDFMNYRKFDQWQSEQVRSPEDILRHIYWSVMIVNSARLALLAREMHFISLRATEPVPEVKIAIPVRTIPIIKKEEKLPQRRSKYWRKWRAVFIIFTWYGWYKRRTSATDVIRKALESSDKQGKMVRYLIKFRRKVVVCQRIWRQYIAQKRLKVVILFLLFKKVELKMKSERVSMVRVEERKFQDAIYLQQLKDAKYRQHQSGEKKHQHKAATHPVFKRIQADMAALKRQAQEKFPNISHLYLNDYTMPRLLVPFQCKFQAIMHTWKARKEQYIKELWVYSVQKSMFTRRLASLKMGQFVATVMSDQRHSEIMTVRPEKPLPPRFSIFLNEQGIRRMVEHAQQLQREAEDTLKVQAAIGNPTNKERYESFRDSLLDDFYDRSKILHREWTHSLVLIKSLSLSDDVVGQVADEPT